MFLDKDKIKRFETAMRRGERFPAIAVVDDAGRLFVRNGFHRVAADARRDADSAAKAERHV